MRPEELAAIEQAKAQAAAQQQAAKPADEGSPVDAIDAGMMVVEAATTEGAGDVVSGALNAVGSAAEAVVDAVGSVAEGIGSVLDGL